MKKLKVVLPLLFVAFIIAMCNKNEQCLDCNDTSPAVLASIEFSNYTLTGYNSSYPSLGKETTVFFRSENSNLTSLMDSIRGLYGINGPAGCTSVCLSLYYDTLYVDSLNLSSIAAVYYYLSGGTMYADYWEDGGAGFVKYPILSGISTFISKQDLFGIDSIRNLNSQEIVMLINSSLLPAVKHHSSFQAQIDYLLPTDELGSKCNNVPECTEDVPGRCLLWEHQSGGEQSGCLENLCDAMRIGVILDDESISVNPDEIDGLYKIRDEFLLNSSKGHRYIN
ncbi:MAG: hypothetical protein ACYC1Q_03200, partial [Bacteroidia bacterium]